jgi:hypothetical protein
MPHYVVNVTKEYQFSIYAPNREVAMFLGELAASGEAMLKQNVTFENKEIVDVKAAEIPPTIATTATTT